MVCVAAVYPNRPGSRFDVDYYRHRHAPFAARLLAPHGLTAIRMSAGVASLDGAPPAYWMMSEMHFASRAVFDAAMARCGEALFADAANFTDVEPMLQLNADAIDLAPHDFMEIERDA